MDNLKEKEKALVAAYLESLNQVQAYMEVTGCTYQAANSYAYAVFNRPRVKEAIETELDKRIISSKELLERYHEIVHGKINDYILPDGKLDLKKITQDKKFHLIKKIQPGKFGDTIEFVDYQRALDTLAKITGILDGSRVTVNVVTESLEDKLERVREKLNVEPN